ncbi:MAG: universal stress protein [Victivallales bacterium]|nr:universal stress protein [Victivallales bacterium]
MPESKRILFCTDFSENARIAFNFAIDEAARSPSSDLFLLHVLPPPDATYWKPYIYQLDDQVDKKAKDEFEQKVQQEYASSIPANTTFKPIFRVGKPDQEILKAAQELQVDLVVLGRQGRGALQTFFFGSIASKVVQKAACPVLVIPPKATK